MLIITYNERERERDRDFLVQVNIKYWPTAKQKKKVGWRKKKIKFLIKTAFVYENFDHVCFVFVSIQLSMHYLKNWKYEILTVITMKNKQFWTIFSKRKIVAI